MIRHWSHQVAGMRAALYMNIRPMRSPNITQCHTNVPNLAAVRQTVRTACITTACLTLNGDDGGSFAADDFNPGLTTQEHLPNSISGHAHFTGVLNRDAPRASCADITAEDQIFFCVNLLYWHANGSC